jgi:hypothetical protein
VDGERSDWRSHRSIALRSYVNPSVNHERQHPGALLAVHASGRSVHAAVHARRGGAERVRGEALTELYASCRPPPCVSR